MAMTFVCPKGDQSEDPDYCSVCGIKMEGVPAPAAMDGSIERCPSCGIQRKPGARFCETCRYDFKAQSSTASAPTSSTATAVRPDATGSITTAPAQAAPAESTLAINVMEPPDTAIPAQALATSTRPAPPATSASRSWEALVSVDPTLDLEPDADSPCPTDAPERTFPLDLAENLIGRRSAARGILPSITLNDPGVSHRHLMVYRNPDATLTVSDLGSTNGTFLNGSTERLEPGVKTPVTDGDRVELGRWTRIVFRSRS